jgi:hypothetical protein
MIAENFSNILVSQIRNPAYSCAYIIKRYRNLSRTCKYFNQIRIYTPHSVQTSVLPSIVKTILFFLSFWITSRIQSVRSSGIDVAATHEAVQYVSIAVLVGVDHVEVVMSE